MIIQPFSDLHLDFDRYVRDFPVHPETDVVVYAGDLGENIEKNFAWMDKQLNGKPAIYILGNHEFYRGTINKKIKQANDLSIKYPNIYFLNNTYVTIDGVNFYGSTLWTDFFKSDTLSQMLGNLYMQDYKLIKNDDYSKLTPLRTIVYHNHAVASIQNFLVDHENETNVIVTHHAPSARSVNPKYKGDKLNAAYYSDLDYIFDYNPKLWIHGHMHDAVHYVAGKTQVVCNPGGYVPYETGKNGFNPNMLMKV